MPRIRVAAVLRIQGRIVLVQHEKDGHTYHLLPGGGVERNESVAEALGREVREETGLQSRIVRPLFISDTIAPDGSRHVIHLTFLCESIGNARPQAPVDDERVKAVVLADETEIAGLNLRPPLASALVAAAQEGFMGEARYLGPLWVEERTSPGP